MKNYLITYLIFDEIHEFIFSISHIVFNILKLYILQTRIIVTDDKDFLYKSKDLQSP